MLTRLLAALTTVVLALGLTVGVGMTASANNVTCNSLGYTKFDSASGSETLPWGTLVWSGASLTHAVSDGWTVDLCIKSGSQAATSTYENVAGTATLTITQDISHIGYKEPTRSPGLTCDAATLYTGSPLTNGDHINMNVTRNGGAVFQVNAYVDIRQSNDPASESGLVVRVRLDSGTSVLPLTNAQKASGMLAFEYSKAWTGAWTVQWVQYNSSYFNQNNDSTKYRNCAKATPVVIAVAPSATNPTCDADGRLTLPTPPTGITWSGGAAGAGPGTYTIVANVATGYTLNGAPSQWVIQVLPKGTGLRCGPPPCIASNQVSYTYNPATNSGTVTVPNPAGSSGKLCNGFWVTAVSWKFIGSGVWPQALDQNNPMPENGGAVFVDEPGTYTYGAQVVCGQGDIYASYEAQPVPTATLTAPGQPFAEHFLHQMGFQGPKPTYTVDKPGCNEVAPVKPIATVITECGTDGSILAGPTVGVVYSLTKGDGVSGPWEITATPASNYTFDGAQAVTFTGDLGEKTDCTQPVKPVPVQAECNVATGSVAAAYITIPATEGIQYRVDGTLYPAASKVNLGVGSHTVKYEELPGFTNTGPSDDTIVITDDPDCDDPVEYLTPAVQHEICDATTGETSGGELTFTRVENLTYRLDGAAVVFPADAKTVTVPVTAGSHTVTYDAGDGFYLTGTKELTRTSETLTVSTPDGCDDPVKYAAPVVVHETCNAVAGGARDGVVTFTLPPHLSYVFDGTPVTSADLTIEKAAGTYRLVVTADQGYFITGGGTTEVYPITVDAARDCGQLITFPVDPFPTHEECVAGSATGATTQGTITIVKADHVAWQISNDADGVKYPVDTSGAGPNIVFAYPAGNYHVWAIADQGHVISGPDTFPMSVKKPSFPCSLTTHAQLPTGASWTHQVCTPSGLTQPTITVEPFPGVSYFIDGRVVTSSTTAVTPGLHQITAAADDPADTVTVASWSPTLLAASAAVCGDLTTLALTGETPGGWLILAIVLLQAGLVLVAVRFVRTRGEQGARHLA